MAPPLGELSAQLTEGKSIMVRFIKWLPLTRELSAQQTEGEKSLDILQTVSFLSLRQNLRFCHLPRQREALIFYDTVMHTAREEQAPPLR